MMSRPVADVDVDVASCQLVPASAVLTAWLGIVLELASSRVAVGHAAACHHTRHEHPGCYYCQSYS